MVAGRKSRPTPLACILATALGGCVPGCPRSFMGTRLQDGTRVLSGCRRRCSRLCLHGAGTDFPEVTSDVQATEAGRDSGELGWRQRVSW